MSTDKPEEHEEVHADCGPPIAYWPVGGLLEGESDTKSRAYFK